MQLIKSIFMPAQSDGRANANDATERTVPNDAAERGFPDESERLLTLEALERALPNESFELATLNEHGSEIVTDGPSSPPSPPGQKVIAFFDSVEGCGFATLLEALKDDQICICLVQDAAWFAPVTEKWPNLRVVEGSTVDLSAVTECLKHPFENRLVDAISYVLETIVPEPGKGPQDVHPTICQEGMAVILEALLALRRDNFTGWPIIAALGTVGYPEITTASPVPRCVWMYFNLNKLREDKKVMEEMLYKSKEKFVIIRPNFFLRFGQGSHPVQERMDDVIQEGEYRRPVGGPLPQQAVAHWIYEKVLKAGVTAIEGTAMSIGW